jgi:hypothetical protein
MNFQDISNIGVALAYSKHLKERPEGYEKPIVYFIGTARFDTELFPDTEVAHVLTVNHQWWGRDKVRTSSVVKKHDDGSFETLNTLYKPYKQKEDGES